MSFHVVLFACTIILFVLYVAISIRVKSKTLEDIGSEATHSVIAGHPSVLKFFFTRPIWLQETLKVFPFLLYTLIIFNFFIIGTTVMSGSMEPKLKVGHIVLYNRLDYKKHMPERGDIIFFRSDELDKYLAKRVIGIPGDHLEFLYGNVYINGMKAEESAYIANGIETNSLTISFIVPDNSVFVLGDRRETSYDSRFWKEPFISSEDIMGKYLCHMGPSITYLIAPKSFDNSADSVPFHVGWDSIQFEYPTNKTLTIPDTKDNYLFAFFLIAPIIAHFIFVIITLYFDITLESRLKLQELKNQP